MKLQQKAQDPQALQVDVSTALEKVSLAAELLRKPMFPPEVQQLPARNLAFRTCPARTQLQKT